MWRIVLLNAGRSVSRGLPGTRQATEHVCTAAGVKLGCEASTSWAANTHSRWQTSAAAPEQGSIDTIFNEKSSVEPAHEAVEDASSAGRKQLSRLMYRAKQRGWLEMDLLVGMWAERNLPKADPPMLAAFEELLDEENPDLLKWLTGQLEPPEALRKNPAFVAVYRDTQKQLGDHTLQKANAAGNKEWIRGWDDWNRTDEQPNTAAAEAAGTKSPDK